MAYLGVIMNTFSTDIDYYKWHDNVFKGASGTSAGSLIAFSLVVKAVPRKLLLRVMSLFGRRKGIIKKGIGKWIDGELIQSIRMMTNSDGYITFAELYHMTKKLLIVCVTN